MKLAATRALYSYWDSLRADRSAPERGDLDPAAIRTVLGDVLLLDLNDTGCHLVRLAGTRICALLGYELKGHPFVEPFIEEDRPVLVSLVNTVAGSATPVVVGLAGEADNDCHLDLELLLLPLRHHGRTHSRLLGSLAAVETPYWAGTKPLSRLRLVSVRHLHRRNDEVDLVSSPVRAVGGPLRVLPGGRA